MTRPVVSVALLTLLGMVPAGVSLAAEEELDKLKAKLAREDDAPNRAKITVKLGRVLLNRVRHAYQEEQYEIGEAVLAEYMGYIRTAHQDLKKTGRNARKKPKGFKDLEIHLRKSIRLLDDLARAVPYTNRASLTATKQEMEVIWHELIAALFGLPQPEETSEEKKP